MNEKEWIRKIIEWCAENGDAGGDVELRGGEVEKFMKEALQKCAKDRYGNVVYRAMCGLSDEQKLRVVSEMDSCGDMGIDSSFGTYASLVLLAERLAAAQERMKKFGV